jgi:hypothetical protein
MVMAAEHHPMPRGRLLNFRVNDEEWRRLARLADHYGLTVSGVVRMLIKRDAVALGHEPAVAPPVATPAKPSTKPRKR